MLCEVMTGCALYDTPPHAASTKTWTFGLLTWSDVIQMPECDKTGFIDYSSRPDCRSYTAGKSTWYYYNWSYVNTNKSMMCPAPWRIPLGTDLRYLEENANEPTLSNLWGRPGVARGDKVIDLGTRTALWSATLYASGAYHLIYSSSGVYVYRDDIKNYGFQVRCVK
jgi:hypothetical protein